MPNKPPRLRVFAGPNGSGKSSLFPQLVKQRHFNAISYINSDDIQSNLNKGVPVQFPLRDGSNFLQNLRSGGFVHDGLLLADALKNIEGDPAVGLGLAKGAICDGYMAAAISEAIRELFLAEQSSFGFETVLSHPSKIVLMHKAHDKGFKVYLYFVSTGDPRVNVERVRQRV